MSELDRGLFHVSQVYDYKTSNPLALLAGLNVWVRALLWHLWQRPRT